MAASVMPMLRNTGVWIIAILLASLLPALLFAVFAFDGRIVPGKATGTAFALAFGVALLHVLVIGVPVAQGLRRRGRGTVLHWLLAGFVAGAVPCTLLLLWQSGGVPEAMRGLLNPVIGVIVLTAGGFGALAAGVLWGVLRFARPPLRP